MRVPLACWQAGPTLINKLFTDEIAMRINSHQPRMNIKFNYVIEI